MPKTNDTSVLVTLHEQHDGGFKYTIKSANNITYCWQRGTKAQVSAYCKDLQHKLNARWNEGPRPVYGTAAARRSAKRGSKSGETSTKYTYPSLLDPIETD